MANRKTSSLSSREVLDNISYGNVGSTAPVKSLQEHWDCLIIDAFLKSQFFLPLVARKF